MGVFVVIAAFFVLLVPGVLAAFIPREQRPNARILTECKHDYWKIEVVCQDCGAKRRIAYPWPDAPQVILCTECGCNIVPTFLPEDLNKFLAACKEMLAQETEAAASKI